MTVGTQSNFVVLAGDGANVDFPFSFPVYDEDDLVVFVKTTATGVIVTEYDPGDYTVTGIGNENGGSITLPVAPSELQKVVISRQVPMLQELDIENEGGFYPDNAERQFDLQEMQIQQLAEALARALLVPLGETFDGDLGTIEDRADALVGFDANSALKLYSSADFAGPTGPAGPTIDISELFTLLQSVIVEGSGIDVVYDGVLETITITAPGAGLTSENVLDLIGGALTNVAGMFITPDDLGDTIGLAVDPEFIRDTVAAFLTQGFGITLTNDDPGDTLTIARASPAIQSVVSAATVTPTFSNDQVEITAQAEALTLANPTGTAKPGFGISIRIKDNGTARAITYGNQYRAIGVTLPTTTVISKTLYLGMVYNAADTKWDILAVQQEA